MYPNVGINCMFDLMNSMNGVFVIIGGNLGNREANIEFCRKEIENKIGLICNASAIYETQAWGKTDVPNYLNQVLQIITHLSPFELLTACLSIEKSMGRIREEKWASRLIDIDILLFNQEKISDEKLSIPHPYLHERKFVLVPLCEIAPQHWHPVLLCTISALNERCKDELAVKKISG